MIVACPRRAAPVMSADMAAFLRECPDRAVRTIDSGAVAARTPARQPGLVVRGPFSSDVRRFPPRRRHEEPLLMSTAALPRAQHDKLANAIRSLAMDAVEKAKSGHPGMPMGTADVATVLFSQLHEVRCGEARPGPTATASCCPPATARCWSMRCCYLTGDAGHDARRAEAFPPARLEDRRGTPRTVIAKRHRDHHRPARPGASPMPSAWRWPRRCSPREFGQDRRSITTPMSSPPTADLMEGISQEAIAMAGHLEAEQADRAVRRQRHLHRWPDCRSPTSSRPGEALRRPRAGTCRARRRS